ncbi:hypothetical protein EJ08DRAFT_668566 [Tothia fuscella]|uniref:Uncharacterized protein n=1 Tax=Tothia fuscella TaxID=1048955 RepID=A0A9P4NYC3_9PEZI|nr:hypothetical protein EJ08DRAFT_668566 [Tothia fuscella]
MRLLKASPSGDFELTSFNNDCPPRYAILSHTWSKDQEVIYGELLAGADKRKSGYAKIRFCGERAAADNLELQTAINLMFQYYQRSTKYYAYLSDVQVPEGIDSRWFTRGWTLQELLAPPIVEGQRPFSAFSFSEKLSWAAQRTTTVKEDKVYCLLGIFGVLIPVIYGEGEAYASERLKDEIARRQQGRGTENFFIPNPHRRITVYGLGGYGKSALVLEFIYRALARDARQSFELAYRETRIHLRILGITDDNTDIKQLVKEALKNMGNYNPGSPRLLDYIPYNNKGKVIFTTRNRKAAGDLTQANVLKLQDLGKAEAIDLLTQRITKRTLLADRRAAAAFINNNDISIAAYVSLIRNAGTEIAIFSEKFEDPSRYHEMDSTIAKTWYVSFNQIRKQDKLAVEYLSFIACIDRINIPQSLLPPKNSPLQHTKAIGTLKGYTFITERQQTVPGLERKTFFDIHRLVHIMSARWLDRHNKQEAWTAKAVERLEEVVPYGGRKEKDTWTTYLPHAIYLTRLDNTLDDAVQASLLDRIRRCQSTLGQYSAAEVTHRQALAFRERGIGQEDSSTLTSMNELAVALSSQGKYAEAESMHRQTLATREKVLGTLATREKVLGVDHPSTLTSVYSLAHLLGNQRHYDEADLLYRRACTGQKKVLGNNHPSTRACLKHYSEMLISREGSAGRKLFNRGDV